jgi:hypothetical protein
LRWQRLASGALCAALLAGCTATFTYNHLDWLIPWFVDGYVDLTREQRKALQGRLEPLLQWHRAEELDRYIAILDRIESELAEPVTADTVQSWIDETLSAAERTEQSTLRLALDFGATLSEAQMAELVASLWERQREYEKEFLARTDEKYREEAYENLAELLQRFVGRLESPQEQRLRTAARALERFDDAWLEERAQWLSELEPLLQRPPGWQQDVQAAYSARKTNRTPRYKAGLSHNLGIINQAMADVLNQLSGRQRRQMADEFEDLRGRLRKLRSQSPNASPPTEASVVGRLPNEMVVKADRLEINRHGDAFVDTVNELHGLRIRGNRQEAVHVGR